jgi:hypothetical protein
LNLSKKRKPLFCSQWLLVLKIRVYPSLRAELQIRKLKIFNLAVCTEKMHRLIIGHFVNTTADNLAQLIFFQILLSFYHLKNGSKMVYIFYKNDIKFGKFFKLNVFLI